MKKYYKRMLTYYEVSENGNYIAVLPLISQITVTSGLDFRSSKLDEEITEQEFHEETHQALAIFRISTRMVLVLDTPKIP